MENDFISLTAMLGFMFFPFAFIFLILMVFNWNGKKSLFSDSWFVYLAWILFGTLAGLAGLIADEKFRIETTAPIMASFYISIIIIQSSGIAAVLFWRSRPKNMTSLVYGTEVNSDVPRARKIWKTAFLVTILTFLMMLGLVTAIEDLDNKLSPKNNGVSFGIYD
jgi:hypothetical protein